MRDESRGTYAPECPRCRWVDEDWWDGLRSNQTSYETECARCGTPLHVEIDHTVSFDTTVIRRSTPTKTPTGGEK